MVQTMYMPWERDFEYFPTSIIGIGLGGWEIGRSGAKRSKSGLIVVRDEQTHDVQ
jgi:hypothetical protein